jgi:hypothetical protein
MRCRRTTISVSKEARVMRSYVAKRDSTERTQYQDMICLELLLRERERS